MAEAGPDAERLAYSERLRNMKALGTGKRAQRARKRMRELRPGDNARHLPTITIGEPRPVSNDVTRLRDWLSDRGMSQRALARLLGEDYRLVRRWCAAQKPIPADVWVRMRAIPAPVVADARSASWGRPGYDA